MLTSIEMETTCNMRTFKPRLLIQTCFFGTAVHDSRSANPLNRLHLFCIVYIVLICLLFSLHSPTDLEKLLHQSHFIDGKVISVKKEPPKKRVPLDPIRVLVRGLNEKITEDCLLFYLERCTDVAVKEVTKCFNNNAVAVFEAEPGTTNVTCLSLSPSYSATIPNNASAVRNPHIRKLKLG